ncbi:hypothetical protein BH20ACI1_BH20ACI1_26720 [soil metagenome]
MSESESGDDRWERLKILFNEAVELAPETRSQYLSELRLNQNTLYQEIAELIEVDGKAEDFLGKPAAIEFEELPDSLVGETVGNYRIVREVERGGMGVVYEAVRFDGEFEQRVAVKLVNRHFFSSELISRFKRERQILARLEHPNIIRLLDGGLTGDRTPYYVMEFVEGMPVNVYCRENELGTNKTLEIFLQICSAVAFAHRQLIVHRDLKLSNILITKCGEAKLLDFGIAKILDADADVQTLTINAPLTPAYASPEQIKGEAITTGSDVYSLGVILYELLTGKNPEQIYQTNKPGLPQAICETDPPSPSAALSSKSKVQSPKSSEVKSSDSENSKSNIQTSKSLRGDLDNIVLKALQKEPERRYASVEQFAEDIRFFLGGLPVKTHPQSFEYRASKFIKRNRLLVGLSAAAILLIAVGIGVAVWQFYIAQHQRQIAEQRFAQVRKIANSFIFDYHDEIAKLDGSTALREKIVSDGVTYLDAISQEETADADLLKETAIAYRKIGDAQGKPYVANLGKMEDATVSYGKSVALLENAITLAPNDLTLKDEFIESSRLLANVQGRSNRREMAIQTMQKAISLNQELINFDENDVERQITSLSLQIALGDADYNTAPYEQTLEKAEAVYKSAPQNENLIFILKKLTSRAGAFALYMGKSARSRNETEESQLWFSKSLQHSNREVYLTENFPNVIKDKRHILDAYLNHAGILKEVGQSDEAMKSLKIAGEKLQELKNSNADDREIPLFEIWYLTTKVLVLEQQNKNADAFAVANKGLDLAVDRTEADPTNIKPISWTLRLANEAEKLCNILKNEKQAANYRKIKNKYEPQYKKMVGSDFSYVF